MDWWRSIYDGICDHRAKALMAGLFELFCV
jgi:hypothetical protein